jgi:hypothetical protein
MLYSNQKSLRCIVNNRKRGHLQVASILFAATASLLSAPHTTHAECNTYYVSTNGNDANPGSITKPMLSIHQAAKKLAPCDTLYVRGGIYKQFGIWVSNNGTESAPIRILAYPNEYPILDGTGLTMQKYSDFIDLPGQYIILSGLELRNGKRGVWIIGNHNTVSNMNIHDVQQQGIFTTADFSTIENNTVSFTALENRDSPNKSWAFGIGSFLGYDKSDIVNNMIIRGNTIHDIWGEGIQTFQSDGAIVENNIVYDCWARNYYITASYNLLFRNNLAYNTPNNAVGRRSEGITFADEAPLNPVSSNNIIINNMFYNADFNAYSWTIIPGTGLTNVLIANNTIVNGKLMTGKINKTSVFQNNIFYRNDGGEVASVPNSDGLTFNNNLWSSPPPPNVSGNGDTIGDPKLALTDVAIPARSAIPGQFTTANFALPFDSAVIGKGKAVYAVNNNWLVTSKSIAINIGAYTSNPPISYLPTP